MRAFILAAEVVLATPAASNGASLPATGMAQAQGIEMPVPPVHGLRQAGRLRVGADPSSGLPYFAFNAQGESEGFEGDLAKSLAKRLRLTLHFVPTPWRDLPSAVKQGRIDAAINALEPKAIAGIAWSRPYYWAGQAIMVRGQSPQGPTRLRDLAGRRVATTRGSTAERMLQSLRPRPFLLLSNNLRAPIQTLAAQGAEAVFLEAAMLRYQAHKSPGLFKVSSSTIRPKPYAIALREEDLALHAAIDVALEDMIAQKELSQILANYGLNDASQSSLLAAPAAGH